MRRVWAVVCVLLLAGGQVNAGDGVSFDEVRGRLFSDAFPDVPEYPLDGFPELWIIRSLFTGDLFGRFRATLDRTEDFKEEGFKPVHRAGICADATWRITGRTVATGLLAQGTDVRAIVRFATGTNRTVANGILPRTFGIAVKLFPSRNPSEKVVTRNLFIFDQTGLDGDTRDHFLPRTGKGELLRFSNVVPATTAGARATEFMLGRFDKKPHLRELFSLTDVDGEGRPVARPITPYALQLIPASEPPATPIPDDYRRELRAYAPGQLVFNIVLPEEKDVRGPIELGTLTVGQWVMSRTCDETLHFPHPRSR